MNRKKSNTVIQYIVLFLIAAVFLLPMLWLLLASIDPGANAGISLPEHPTIQNYLEVFQDPFPVFLRHLVRLCVIIEESLQESLQPFILQLRKLSVRTDQFPQIMRERDSLGLAENEKSGEIFRLFQKCFTVFLRILQSLMGSDHPGEFRPGQKFPVYSSRLLLICPDLL